MSKVLLIDNGFTGLQTKSLYGIQRFDNFNDGALEKTINFVESENKNSWNITKTYSKKGFNKHEVHVLTEPKVELCTDYIYYMENSSNKDHMLHLLKRTFDIPSALKKIEKINPEHIFLDLKFLIEPPKEFKELYYKKYCDDCVEKNYLVYEPNVFGGEKKERTLITKINSFEEFKDIKYNALRLCGGAVFGKILKDNGIKFTFWTSEMYHAKNALTAAFYLNVVSSEELISLDNNYHLANKGFMNDLAKEYGLKSPLNIVYNNTKTIFTEHKRIEKIDDAVNLKNL
ncbi:hypothetical protein K9L67_00230 [Candidatus Woesearchaeota archaeon]|nr:hypothetical protein [Candidatus Woesearchaeota archaeon]MCF7900633.1 hypothetical protein [Candidatus Woesearchaeota archaeon]MCF8013473.1 hypothetical protein [Candidatus Woesearchaeota archaeon]